MEFLLRREVEPVARWNSCSVADQSSAPDGIPARLTEFLLSCETERLA
jgi:hypothetical protein